MTERCDACITRGLDNELIYPAQEMPEIEGDIRCRERLGGMLRYYYREVA